jgi:hypothetical protein
MLHSHQWLYFGSTQGRCIGRWVADENRPERLHSTQQPLHEAALFLRLLDLDPPEHCVLTLLDARFALGVRLQRAPSRLHGR